jgi:hypothetical protein
MDLATENGVAGPAEGDNIRAVLMGDGKFEDFVILSRSPTEFLQAGHWFWVGRSTDNPVWCTAFDAATAGMPAANEDSSGPDLYTVEFRDREGLWGVRQVFSREQLLDLFLGYLRGGEGWRAGLEWERLTRGA